MIVTGANTATLAVWVAAGRDVYAVTPAGQVLVRTMRSRRAARRAVALHNAGVAGK